MPSLPQQALMVWPDVVWFSPRSVARESFPGTIPTRFAWLILITFDQPEQFLGVLLDSRTRPYWGQFLDRDVWTAPSPPPSYEMKWKQRHDSARAIWSQTSLKEFSRNLPRILPASFDHQILGSFPSLNKPTGHVQTCLEICMRRSDTCLELQMPLVKFGALKVWTQHQPLLPFSVRFSRYFSSVLMPLLQRSSRMPCMSTTRFRPSQTDWNKPWHNW